MIEPVWLVVFYQLKSHSLALPRAVIVWTLDSRGLTNSQPLILRTAIHSPAFSRHALQQKRKLLLLRKRLKKSRRLFALLLVLISFVVPDMSSGGEYLVVNGIFSLIHAGGAIYVGLKSHNLLPTLFVAGSVGLHYLALRAIDKKTTRNSSSAVQLGVAANVLAAASWGVGMPWPVAFVNGGLGTAAAVFYMLMSGFAA